jgi:hypothetical protein
MACVGTGGDSCGSAPCSYGCTSTQSGFLCNCPGGFQRIDQGHCLSAASASDANLGVDIPHVAGVVGESNLPPGEGCYQCGKTQGIDTVGGGVPLVKRAQRQRRDVEKLFADPTQRLAPSQLIIDVSGPHAVPPANIDDQQADSVPDDDLTVVNAADLRRLASRINTSASLPDLKSSQPLVIYIHRNATTPDKDIIQILPSLKTLTANEVCSLVGDESILQYFNLEQKQAITSLRFTKRQQHSSIYELTVKCRPIIDTIGKVFAVDLQVHVI